jgi:TonB-linked SusC/RagA family outer membrane protein
MYDPRCARGLMTSILLPALALFGVLPNGVRAERAVASSSSEFRQQPQATQGIVEGLIVDRATKRPLPGVQVFIEGTRIGGLTSSAGRYRIANVPAGNVTVSAVMIGYSKAQRASVAVTAARPATVNFEMAEAALALDAIVVTGTPGGTQRKAVGNVVDRVDVSKRAEVTAAPTVMQLLSQQTPGVYMPGGGGMVGAANASPRIRGVSSLSLSSNPILYIDGVRADNSATGGPELRGGRMVNRMNDINPNDIESIEIIKGPAAATLYGTEASAGVIQIITKKGASGAPSIEMSVRQGVNDLANPSERFHTTYNFIPGTGVLDSMNIYREWAEGGPRCRGPNPGDPCPGPIFTNGHLQYYSGSIRGGSDRTRYFISAGYDDETGIVDYNTNKKLNTRANISVMPSEKLEFTANLGYVASNTRFAQAATGLGIWEAIVWTNPNTCTSTTRCFRYLPPEVAAEVEARSKVGRFTGSFQLAHKPFTWLDQRLTLGLDQGTDLSSQLWPKVPAGQEGFFGAANVGQKIVRNLGSRFASIDYGATGTVAFKGIKSATSAGLQFQARQREELLAQGVNFPAPTITTIGGASTRVGSELWEENKTLGLYIQEQLTFREDRAFVTVALRGDANSAFGEEFKAAYYPKFSATWVLSDEPFWKWDFFDQLRLRTAYGKAGMQPGTFDAVTLYDPQTGPGGLPMLTPRTKGNPALRPEVGEELEVGFDMAMLQNRLSLEYTFYNKNTTDALLNVPVQPSIGFPGSEVQNLGKVHNWGHELSLNLNAIEREKVGLKLGLSFANQENVIKDLGGYVPLATANNQVGYPINTFFAKKLLSADFSATRQPVNLMCDGGTGKFGRDPGGAPTPCAQAPEVVWLNGYQTPTWLGSGNASLRIGSNLTFTTTIDYQGGHNLASMLAGSARSMLSTPYVNPYTDPMMLALVNQTDGLENETLGRFDAGFAILRELGVLYNLPSSFAERVGAARGSFSLAARNVTHLWEAQKFVYGVRRFDPEASGTEIPPTSNIIGTLRFTF